MSWDGPEWLMRNALNVSCFVIETQAKRKTIMFLCENATDFKFKKRKPERFNFLTNELVSVLERIDKELKVKNE